MAGPAAPPAGTAGPAPDEPPRDRDALRVIAAEYVATTAAGPHGWEQLLTVAAAGLPYGFTGAVLVAAQQARPVPVASYDEWRSAGWRIPKGQHGALWTLTGADQRPIALFTRDQVQPARGRQHSPLPAGAIPYRRDPPGAGQVLGALIAEAQRRSFAVSRPADQPGPPHTDWRQQQIIIPAALPDVAAAAAVAVELAHITAAAHPRQVITPAAKAAAGSAIKVTDITTDKQRPAASTTAGIAGTPAIEARSAAWLVLSRLGLDPAAAGLALPPAPAWAAPDPRSPLAGILTAIGERTARTAASICQHAEKILETLPPPPAPVTAAAPQQTASRPDNPAARRRHAAQAIPRTMFSDTAAVWKVPDQHLITVNAAAAQFYRAQLPGSWAAGYLAGRGFTAGITRRWQLGFAPAQWSGLADHLQAAGYSPDVLIAAGLARRSRSTSHLIDVFRDRVIIPLRGPHGQIIGFAGRARDGAPNGTAKYLNTAGTAIYAKGTVLFGLAEAGASLDRGARPVLVEGYLDAIAVTEATGGQLAGLAPGGTALSRAQMQDLAAVCDLLRSPLLAARDADAGGRKAAVRDWEIIAPFSPGATTPVLPDGADPADLFKEGPQVLATALAVGEHPLADVVVDAVLHAWEGKLEFAEGQLGAVRQAAGLLAKSPPQDMTRQLVRLSARTGMPHEEVFREMAEALHTWSSSPKARPRDAPPARRAAPGRPGDFPQPPAPGRGHRPRHASTAPRRAGGTRRTRRS